MTNLTIALDVSTIRKARIRAIQDGTSVSAKVREFLVLYAQGQQLAKAAALPSLPVFGGSVDGKGGLRPGINPASNRAMLDAADGLDTGLDSRL